MSTRIAAEAGVNSIEHGYAITDDVLKLMAAKEIFLVPTDYPADFYVNGLGGGNMTPGAAAGVACRRESLRDDEPRSCRSRDEARRPHCLWLGRVLQRRRTNARTGELAYRYKPTRTTACRPSTSFAPRR